MEYVAPEFSARDDLDLDAIKVIIGGKFGKPADLDIRVHPVMSITYIENIAIVLSVRVEPDMAALKVIIDGKCGKAGDLHTSMHNT